MAKKTLLSEAVVRRFMGLAGMQANVVSNHLSENYTELEEEYTEGMHADKKEEDMHEGHYMEDEKEPVEEAEHADADEKAEEADMEDDMEDDMEADMEDAAEATVDEDKIAAALDALADLEALVEPLAAAAGLDAEEAEAEMDMDDAADDMEDALGDMPPAPEAPAMADDAEDKEEALVMEVARRVAKRILKARKAQQMLDEALGNE